MRIGLYPGTFNPVHNGHLQTALETLENLTLDKIIFIPTSSPPHKDEIEMICPQMRYEMVQQAIEGIPRFEVSDVEFSKKKTGKKTYTIDTVKYFASLYPNDDLFLIVGGDAFLDFALWKKAREFIGYTNIVVNIRPGSNEKKVRDFAKRFFKDGETLETDLETDICVTNIFQKGSKSVLINAVRQLDVSSTNIRLRFQTGQDISFLVPPAVLKLIGK